MKKSFNLSFEYYEKVSDLCPEDILLHQNAKSARENAYAPYSQFLVGCAIMMEDGEIYTGNNQENAAYPSGLCAERVAIFHISAMYPHQKIKKIMILGGPKTMESYSAIPPCGACRQSMLEYESKQQSDITILFAGLNGEVYQCQSIKDLLPFSFDVKLLIP